MKRARPACERSGRWQMSRPGNRKSPSMSCLKRYAAMGRQSQEVAAAPDECGGAKRRVRVSGAVQFGEPSHTLMHELANSGPWAAKFKGVRDPQQC